MKSVNTLVLVILAAAVLLAAFAIGLLVRHARMRGAASHEPASAVATPNETPGSETALTNLNPGSPGVRKSDATARADIKQERAEALEKMSNLTEEEKLEFRQRVRDRFNTTRSRSGRLRERMQNMSEEDKQAYRAQVEARLRARRQRALEEAAAKTQEEPVTTEPNVTETIAEPNQGDPNRTN